MVPDKTADDVQWVTLLKQLPDVLGAEIRRDENGQLAEIHILAGFDRTAKQVVRDVQSALQAKFKADIDYRIISVAQIHDERKTPSSLPRIVLCGMALSLADSGCAARVTLTHDKHDYVGQGLGDTSRHGRYLAAAQGATEALNSYLPDQDRLTLTDLRLSNIGEQAIVLVYMTIRQDGKLEQLLGCCADRDDGGLSAARAVLNAVNRRIELLK